jgi:hypothetical protein
MKLAKLMCAFLLLLVFASLCKTFIGWSEDRSATDSGSPRTQGGKQRA